ncbi:MAG: alkene reductase [Planctomycetales bacterium]|nr:alkene reductase [Planctomycetales bacterium]
MTPHHLLSPGTLGDLPVKNRVALAPLTRARAGEQRCANALMAEYYAQRASAGVLITEATAISEEGLGWLNTPGIYTEAMRDSWRQVIDAVHAHETPIILQLWHTGRASHSEFHDGRPPVSASALRLEGDGIHTPSGKRPYETPRALETDELPRLVADYQRAAANARDAGFDGVEIHSANGYLLDQFLQSRTNHRTDAYGGSVENRYRLLGEVVEAITNEFPAARVGVRISPNGVFNDMGSPDFREQFAYVIERLNEFGLAYLHVVDGLGFGFHELGAPMTLSEIRAMYSGALMGNCGYTRETADAAIACGDADFIAFGRPYISNPDLVERFAVDAELNPEADMSDWYAPGGAKGYTDFPTLAS